MVEACGCDMSLNEACVLTATGTRSFASRRAHHGYEIVSRIQILENHRFLKAGFRFSTKAAMPSFWSSVAKAA